MKLKKDFAQINSQYILNNKYFVEMTQYTNTDLD